MQYIVMQKLEEQLLIILEEAGEENISTLINTSLQCQGLHAEVMQVSNCLIKLLTSNFIELETSTTIGQWSPIESTEAGLILLEDAHMQLEWSDSNQIWVWLSAQRVQVCLTKSGTILARKLSERRKVDE